MRCVTDHGTCESYARLSELEGQLNDRFFQCHKSFVVNMDRVTAFASTCFTLSTGERIPVSTRRRAEARLRFLRSLKEGSLRGAGAKLSPWRQPIRECAVFSLGLLPSGCGFAMIMSDEQTAGRLFG